MSGTWYWPLKYVGMFVRVQTMRVKWIGKEHFPNNGPFVLACSHVSHFDPAFLTVLLPRKIDWMARVTFWDNPFGRFILPRVDSFPVKRFDCVPVKSIRTSIQRIKSGRIVGIFPEGGVMRGRESVFFGGSIKGGACLVSQLADVPIIPLTILGTPNFTRVGPWLPFLNGRLWVRIGEPIYPETTTRPRRLARRAMTQRLRHAFISMYKDLRAAFPEIPDSAQGGPSPNFSDTSDAPVPAPNAAPLLEPHAGTSLAAGRR